MENIRYIFILALFLVTIIVSYAYINRYFGTIFNFSSTYHGLEGRCLDVCPHRLNCAGQEDSECQQRCFLQCRKICRLNPLHIPVSSAEYTNDYWMKAFNGTN